MIGAKLLLRCVMFLIYFGVALAILYAAIYVLSKGVMLFYDLVENNNKEIWKWVASKEPEFIRDMRDIARLRKERKRLEKEKAK